MIARHQSQAMNMNSITSLIDRYTAVWNQPDAHLRSSEIAALWTPEGRTSHRLLESCGLAAVKSRVTDAHTKWVLGRDSVFRPTLRITSKNNFVMFNWEMCSATSNEVASVGLNFLQLDPQGYIISDWQFPAVPPVPQAAHIASVRSYVEGWNQSDSSVRRGHIGRTNGGTLRALDRMDGHHDAICFDWEILNGNRTLATTSGTGLLLYTSDGCLLNDVLFER